MSEEHKVKAVLNIGGEIGSTLKGAFNLLTGNIFKIGEVADKTFRKKMGSSISALKKKLLLLTRKSNLPEMPQGNLAEP